MSVAAPLLVAWPAAARCAVDVANAPDEFDALNGRYEGDGVALELVQASRTRVPGVRVYLVLTLCGLCFKTVPESSCDIPCAGDGSTMCGGCAAGCASRYSSIYSIPA